MCALAYQRFVTPEAVADPDTADDPRPSSARAHSGEHGHLLAPGPSWQA
ncbi:hypothetical protein [Streptomyces coelicoflavus]